MLLKIFKFQRGDKLRISYVAHNNTFVELSKMDHQTLSEYLQKKRGNSTRTFVYEVTEFRRRKADMKLFYRNVQYKLTNLRDALHKKYGLEFELEDCHGPYRVLFFHDKYEWTEFYFYFCNGLQGICLKQLELPSLFRNKGIGTFCVDWLKAFARDLGFKYIILGSLSTAEMFWVKMGFRSLTREEVNYFPYR